MINFWKGTLEMTFVWMRTALYYLLSTTAIWEAASTFGITRLNIPRQDSIKLEANHRRRPRGGAYLWLETCVNVVASWPAKAYFVVEKVVSDSSSAACIFVPLHCCINGKGKHNRREWTRWMWFVGICSIPFHEGWKKKSTAYVYKLQILKRQIGSGTSSSGARLVVAVTSAALVSLVFQALPQTVMELPPLLPVWKEAKLIVRRPDHEWKV